jgi:hypothetical protein
MDDRSIGDTTKKVEKPLRGLHGAFRITFWSCVAITLVLLDLYLIYWIMICIWLTAHPLYDHDIWRRRFYLCLAFLFCVLALEATILLRWLRSEPEEGPCELDQPGEQPGNLGAGGQ